MLPTKQYIRLLTPPAPDAITIDEAREWLREDSEDQDSTISLLIRTARDTAERVTGRATLPTEFMQSLDAFPVYNGNDTINGYPIVPWPYNTAVSAISLMRSPVIEVTSLKFYDTSGVLQTVNPSDYFVDGTHEPGRLGPVSGFYWPTTQLRPGAVQITYTAGYATAELIPGNMLLAMRMMLAHWYEHRTEVVQTQMYEVPDSVSALLNLVKVEWEW